MPRQLCNLAQSGSRRERAGLTLAKVLLQKLADLEDVVDQAPACQPVRLVHDLVESEELDSRQGHDKGRVRVAPAEVLVRWSEL